MTVVAANRRGFLCAMLGAGALLVGRRAYGAEPLADVSRLKPGEFIWRPELAPKGPVSVVVSIPEQRVHVYRNGVRIGGCPA